MKKSSAQGAEDPILQWVTFRLDNETIMPTARLSSSKTAPKTHRSLPMVRYASGTRCGKATTPIAPSASKLSFTPVLPIRPAMRCGAIPNNY